MLYIEPQRNWHIRGIITTIIILALLLGGSYILLLSFAPTLNIEPIVGKAPDATQKKLEQPPSVGGDRLYIPQINVDVAIVTGSSQTVLEKGAWHRHPENGDPIKGGNFVLSAHRFVMTFTPQGVAEKSPFYNIDKLKDHDQIFVDFSGKRYAYEIKKTYSVKPNDVAIENQTDDARMTLYSCTLGGSADGRDVIEAAKLGQVAVKGSDS
jgi:sortase A